MTARCAGTRSHWRALYRASHGTTALEFAAVSPLLLLLLFAIVEFGRLFWTQATLQYALDRAARCAATTPSVCSAQSTPAYASSQATALAIPTSDFTYATPTCGYQVSASVPFHFFTQRLFPYSITLSAKSCHPK